MGCRPSKAKPSAPIEDQTEEVDQNVSTVRHTEKRARKQTRSNNLNRTSGCFSEWINEPRDVSADTSYSGNLSEEEDDDSSGYFSAVENEWDCRSPDRRSGPQHAGPGLNVFTGEGKRVERDSSSNSYFSEVDTGLFQGKSLLVLREKEPEANGRYQKGIFEGKNRTYVYQIQGKFKRKPTGPIIFQASVMDDTATLGIVAQTLARTWLSLAQSFGHDCKLNLNPESSTPLGVSCAVRSCIAHVTSLLSLWNTVTMMLIVWQALAMARSHVHMQCRSHTPMKLM